MTPYDKQYIEQRLAEVKEEIGALISLCDGKQRFAPSDSELARYEYSNLKSKLNGLAIHAFESEQGREFCISSGLAIAAELTAKANGSPPELTSSLVRAQLELSDWAFTLSKC